MNMPERLRDSANTGGPAKSIPFKCDGDWGGRGK